MALVLACLAQVGTELTPIKSNSQVQRCFFLKLLCIRSPLQLANPKVTQQKSSLRKSTVFCTWYSWVNSPPRLKARGWGEPSATVGTCYSALFFSKSDWLAGWLGGWVGGWVVGRGWVVGVGWMDGQMDGRMGKWTDG